VSNPPAVVKPSSPPDAAAAPSSLAGPAHFRLISRPEWVEPVVMALAAKARASGVADEEGVKRLVVAMTEAITNAIVHGNYGLSSALKEKPNGAFAAALNESAADPALVNRVVDIRVDFEPGRCVWTITDEGAGFDVAKALARLESDDPMELLASGRGISIMLAFVDEVTWADGGRQVRLAIAMERGPENRGQPRKKYTATIGVRAKGQVFRHEAMARDLSHGGIAFIMTEPLEIGTAVDIVLHLDLPAQQALSGKVVRCCQVSGPYHDIAVKFDTSLKV
jgi:anti-sigma regulatory factor (Ser/Thr protein kinase)